MAIKTKDDLESDIDTVLTTNGTGNITGAQVNNILKDIVDSFEDISGVLNSAGRDGLTPTAGLAIFNTDSKRIEVWSGTEWRPSAQLGIVTLDLSGNPNYPAGLVGDLYIVSVAGNIGGLAGRLSSPGDLIYCTAANAGGTQGAVGGSWAINQTSNPQDIVFQQVVSLTAAQIAALDTGVDLIAAPGAGKILIPVHTVVQYTFVTTKYPVGQLQLKYAGGADVVENLMDEFNNYTGDDIIVMSGFSNNDRGIVKANAKLQLISPIAPSNAGNGTIKVQIYYRIHTL